MNKKGQALVEFILILPVIIFMILGIIDYGTILYNENKLEGKMEEVVTMYESGNTINDIANYIKKDDSNIELTALNEDNKYMVFTLNKKINVLTPGLGIIIDDPFIASAKRTALYE